jgi:hypothetical protein
MRGMDAVRFAILSEGNFIYRGNSFVVALIIDPDIAPLDGFCQVNSCSNNNHFCLENSGNAGKETKRPTAGTAFVAMPN